MTVVYVAGSMRSGTTALAQALAASPDLLLLGEVRPTLLGLREPGRGCDCGESEDRCAYWSTVAGLPDVTGAVAEAFRLRALPTLLAAAWGLRRPSPAVATVVERLRDLDRLAAGRVVVDTSKSASGVLLWRLAGQRVVVAQCVRSPRVVAAKQAARAGDPLLPRLSRSVSVAVWLGNHLGTLAAATVPGVTRRTVGYRRWVADPGPAVAALWHDAGVRPGRVDARGRFEVGRSHMLVGNPRRDRTGAVVVGRREVPEADVDVARLAVDPLAA